MTLYPFGAGGGLLDLTDTTPRTVALESVVRELDAEIARLERDVTAYLNAPDQDGYVDHEAGQLHAYTLTRARLAALLQGGTE